MQPILSPLKLCMLNPVESIVSNQFRDQKMCQQRKERGDRFWKILNTEFDGALIQSRFLKYKIIGYGRLLSERYNCRR